MKKILSLVCIALFAISCSDDDSSTSTTSATVIVKDADGDVVSGLKVYSYQDTIWEGFGDESQFADGSAITNSNGVAKFDDLNYLGTFMQNKQENFYFSAHYSIGNKNYKVAKGETFKIGQSKTITITLSN